MFVEQEHWQAAVALQVPQWNKCNFSVPLTGIVHCYSEQ